MCDSTTVLRLHEMVDKNSEWDFNDFKFLNRFIKDNWLLHFVGYNSAVNFGNIFFFSNMYLIFIWFVFMYVYEGESNNKIL